MKKYTNTSFDRLAFLSVLIFLPSIIFGYLPVIALGMIDGVHIDISLLYVLMSVVVVLHIPYLCTAIPKLYTSVAWRVLAVFASYLWVSVTWSPNTTRAIITAGFMTVLLLLCSIVALRLPEIKKKRVQVFRLGLVAVTASIVFASWQIIADALGIPAQFSGLPQMYSGDVFGIARPTAFALEPQFFGSLLLLPLAWSCWQLFTKKVQLLHYFTYGISGLFLVLTLSRGALLAAFVSLTLLLILTRPPLRKLFRVAILTVASIIVAIGVTFAGASVRSDRISGTDAVVRVVNQLSLGTIDLRQSTATTAPPANTQQALKQAAPKKQSSGYVSSSTSSRLSMSGAALDMWQTNTQTILFGVGIGGFGASLDPTRPSVVVNNYYLELLAETGAVGALLFASFTAILIWQLARRKQWLLLSILIGMFAQMAFFSGNANIIHIWTVVAVAIGVLYDTQKRHRASVS